MFNEPHPLTPYPPLVINLCITGMIPTKALTPHVPIEDDEIISDAIRCFRAGASIIHIHQYEDGQPTWKASRAAPLFRAIREACPGVVISGTTSGRVWIDFERRSEVLELEGIEKPDMASLTLGNTGFGVNKTDMVTQLIQKMSERGIKPEFEVFDMGMLSLFSYFRRKGWVHGTPYFNLLLGSLGDISATIGNLSALVAGLPDDAVWSGCGLGQFQLPMNTASIVAGGGVRVGIEDSIHFDYARTKLATNLELVERIVELAGILQRPIATAQQTREMLGLTAANTAEDESQAA